MTRNYSSTVKSAKDNALVATQMRFDKSGLTKIDRAAEILGSTRSEFVRRSAVQEAEKVLLDQVYLEVDRKSFDFFDNLTSQPPKNGAYEKLMANKSPWENKS